jgi:hypothetical protein
VHDGTPTQVMIVLHEHFAWLRKQLCKDGAVPIGPWAHTDQLILVGMLRVFRQKVTLEDAIGSHACSLEAKMRVTNGIPLGSTFLFPVGTVNCVQTLKAQSSGCLTMIAQLPC